MAYEKTDPDDSVVSEGCGRRRGGEHDPYFESVVTSREVFVVSDDDQEEEMMTEFLGGASCFITTPLSRPPEWKERSTGDIKILRNKQKAAVCPSQSKDLAAVSGGPNTSGPTWATVGNRRVTKGRWMQQASIRSSCGGSWALTSNKVQELLCRFLMGDMLPAKLMEFPTHQLASIEVPEPPKTLSV
ncbi:hypothetical protein O3P69_000343 [Scylla paramamosain]|uniref:RanBD1 domain-containing protein n=1 Tax=Scylla paramamosain TaxID=85552 RepID=A0AAW0V032_SCYPA